MSIYATKGARYYYCDHCKSTWYVSPGQSRAAHEQLVRCVCGARGVSSTAAAHV